MVWKKIIPPVFAACIFPYVVTLGWTGRISSQDSGFHGTQLKHGEIGNLPGAGDGAAKRKIILDRDTETVLDAEEYLIGVVTMQMPIDYEMEALKAQAVIAPKYIYGLLGDAEEVAEAAHDMD